MTFGDGCFFENGPLSKDKHSEQDGYQTRIDEKDGQQIHFKRLQYQNHSIRTIIRWHSVADMLFGRNSNTVKVPLFFFSPNDELDLLFSELIAELRFRSRSRRKIEPFFRFLKSFLVNAWRIFEGVRSK